MVRNLAELYRASMIPHRFGYALYEPAPFTRLHPGKLGYLDEYRLWHPILDLTDPAILDAAGYSRVEYPMRSDPDSRFWSPLVSSNVKETGVALEGDLGGASLGLPVDVGGAVQYRTSTDFGAVLMCDSSVVAEGYDYRNPFKVWLKMNAKKLLVKYPDLKKYGVCVVTWTYSSTNIHINAWDNPGNEVVLGFKAGMSGLGSLGPELSWLRGKSSSGWSSWNDQKRVVFFTGVKVDFTLFGVWTREEKGWRGAEDKFIVDDLEGGKSCEAQIEFIGDRWVDINNEE